MPSVFLRAQRAAFAYAGAEPVLHDLDFQLEPGWTGVAGPNGAGKTTLLRLLSGELAPTRGAIAPRGLRVGLCAQTVDQPPAGAEELSQAWDRDAVRLRGSLDLVDELERWPTLSPGERKRWQLAVALRAEPDVLLLDEPANHLDERGREFLLRALRGYRGVGVVVSHDRTLLEALTTATLWVEGSTARRYPGAYGAAREEREREAQERRDQRDAASAREAALRARLAETRRQQAAAVHQRSAGARMRNRHDSDARGLLADFKAAKAEARLGRGVAVLRRAHEKAAETAADLSFGELTTGPIFAGYERCPRPWLVRAEIRGHHTQFPVPTPGEPQLPLPTVAREDRVWLRGPNGAGKTTLLRSLLADAALEPARVLYLPQDLPEADARAALDGVRALPKDVRGRTLQLVALLGVDPDVLLRSAQPSPGEARKLLLARGLAQHAWLLALDEPTNHLDLPSVERLEAALRDYPGALLLVTHDTRLGAALTTRTLDCEGPEAKKAAPTTGTASSLKP